MTEAKRPSGGLEGAAVLVTGGGTGIGRACAARLAADSGGASDCADDLSPRPLSVLAGSAPRTTDPGRAQRLARSTAWDRVAPVPLAAPAHRRVCAPGGGQVGRRGGGARGLGWLAPLR